MQVETFTALQRGTFPNVELLQSIPARRWCRVTGLRRFAHSFRILFDDASHPLRRDWGTTSIAQASRFDRSNLRLDRISKAVAVAWRLV